MCTLSPKQYFHFFYYSFPSAEVYILSILLFSLFLPDKNMLLQYRIRTTPDKVSSLTPVDLISALDHTFLKQQAAS